jgi:hypothetical protein
VYSRKNPKSSLYCEMSMFARHVLIQPSQWEIGGRLCTKHCEYKCFHTYGILRQDQIFFSTHRTQFTPDFSSASCSGTVCLAKHQVLRTLKMSPQDRVGNNLAGKVSIWRCHVGCHPRLSSGIVIWVVIWSCRLGLSSGVAIWGCHLVLSSGMSSRLSSGVVI